MIAPDSQIVRPVIGSVRAGRRPLGLREMTAGVFTSANSMGSMV